MRLYLVVGLNASEDTDSNNWGRTWNQKDLIFVDTRSAILAYEKIDREQPNDPNTLVKASTSDNQAILQLTLQLKFNEMLDSCQINASSWD